MSADASTIDHEEAASIARGLGTTYTSPSDDAVRTVFEAYLSLRNPPDDGSYPDRASLLARIETLTAERDAAKADAARLREALKAARSAWLEEANSGDGISEEHTGVMAQARTALSATDSAEWLAQHDAEVTEPLRKRITVLERQTFQCEHCGAPATCVGAYEGHEERGYACDECCGHGNEDGRCEPLLATLEEQLQGFRAQVDNLTKQLAAANNDAARAELRARDLRECVSRYMAGNDMHSLLGGYANSANPDSDARLREAMLRVTHRGVVCGESRGSAGIYDEKSRENDVKFIVDEVLGVKP